jgi:hypothetical protein
MHSAANFDNIIEPLILCNCLNSLCIVNNNNHITICSELNCRAASADRHGLPAARIQNRGNPVGRFFVLWSTGTKRRWRWRALLRMITFSTWRVYFVFTFDFMIGSMRRQIGEGRKRNIAELLQLEFDVPKTERVHLRKGIAV